jgi:serine/threonine protein kinase/DNA-binding beta-propeller fold protein YncE
MKELLYENENISPEVFVRKALDYLEIEFRKICLTLLSEITAANISMKPLYEVIASLQRPSWGCWNGFLLGVLKERRAILNSGSPSQREALSQARELTWAAKYMEESEAISDPEFWAKWRNISGQSFDITKKNNIKKRELLAIPIQIRNRRAHDNPQDPAWWADVRYILSFIIKWYTESEFEPHYAHFEPYEPWSFEEDHEVWCFNGIDNKGDGSPVYYVSISGKTKADLHRDGSIMSAFQKIMGEEALQETNFKRLMNKLAPEELKGFLLGGYIVGQKVGEGGFAEVYQGLHLSTGRKVALKILKPGLPEVDRARFLQEAAYLSLFDHPNIVRIYEHNEQPWRKSQVYDLSAEEWFNAFKKSHGDILTYIVIEWIDGQTLDDIYREMTEGETGWNERQIAAWLKESAGALEVIHNANLIHRDISPRNIMITEAGTVKVMDFGISRTQIEDRTIITSHGKLLGSEPYMSPEQLDLERARAELGPRSDLYSLGSTFYELFTQTRIYDHNHDAVSVATASEAKKRGERPKAPHLLNKNLSWEITTILMGCLEIEPADRYQSAQKLKEDLNRYLNDLPIEYKRPSLPRRMRLTYKRHRRVANVSAVFILLIVVSTTIYFYMITNANQELDKSNQQLEETNQTLDKTNKKLDKTNQELKDQIVETNLQKDRAIEAKAITENTLAKMYYKQAEQEISNKNQREGMAYLAASWQTDPQTYTAAKIAALLQNERWPFVRKTLPSGASSDYPGYIVHQEAQKNLELIDLEGKPVRELPNSKGSASIRISPQGNCIAAYFPTGWMTYRIRLWDISGKELPAPQLVVPGLQDKFSQDENWFCINVAPNRFCFYSYRKNESRDFNPTLKASPHYSTPFPDRMETDLVVYDDAGRAAYLYGGMLTLYRYDGHGYQEVNRQDLAQVFAFVKDGLTIPESKRLPMSSPASTSETPAVTEKNLMNNHLWISPDMTTLAVSNAGSFVLMDARTGKTVLSDRSLKYFIKDIAFSRGSSKVAVSRGSSYYIGNAAAGGYVSVFDITKAKEIFHTTEDFDTPFSDLQFSPDNDLLLAKDENNTVHIYQAENGDPYCQPISTGQSLISVKFTSEKNYLLIGESNLNPAQPGTKTDARNLLWNIHNGGNPHLTKLDPSIQQIICSANGRKIFAGLHRALYCLDSLTGKVLFKQRAPIEQPYLASMDVNHKSKKILVTYGTFSTKPNGRSYCQVFTENGTPASEPIFVSGFNPTMGLFSPDGNKVMILFENMDSNGFMRIWDCSSPRWTAIADQIYGDPQQKTGFMKAVWIPKSQRILAADTQNIYILNARGGLISKTNVVPIKSFRVKDLCLAVASGTPGSSSKGELAVYSLKDLEKGKTGRLTQKAFESSPAMIISSPDGKYIAAACEKGDLYIMNFADLALVSSKRKHDGAIKSMQFDNTNQYIATGLDLSATLNKPTSEANETLDMDVPVIREDKGKFIIWNIQQPQPIWTSLRDDKVLGIGLTNDNRFIYATPDNIYSQWVPMEPNEQWIGDSAAMLAGYKLGDNGVLQRVSQDRAAIENTIPPSKGGWASLMLLILKDDFTFAPPDL